jgi:hypothetical protein
MGRTRLDAGRGRTFLSSTILKGAIGSFALLSQQNTNGSEQLFHRGSMLVFMYGNAKTLLQKFIDGYIGGC